MPQTLQLTVKSSIFDKEKLLIIQPELLDFDKTGFTKFEISEYRYGIKAINGFRFVIGRIYCIDIKNLSGDLIQIRLKSVYRIRRKILGQKYISIVNALFENYFKDISGELIQKFNDGIEISILGVSFSQNGVKLDHTSDVIPWLDLGSRNYRTYFSLFSNVDPKKYKTFQYLTDWNTAVLYSVSRSILKKKELL